MPLYPPCRRVLRAHGKFPAEAVIYTDLICVEDYDNAWGLLSELCSDHCLLIKGTTEASSPMTISRCIHVACLIGSFEKVRNSCAVFGRLFLTSRIENAFGRSA